MAGSVPRARDLCGDVLRMEAEARRDGRETGIQTEMASVSNDIVTTIF
jgi:hypothetical protein